MLFGISYGEILVIVGAAAALIGPKDLPRIGRAAGRLAGRAVGYVQIARGHLDTVFQQSQARQVHKELLDTVAQLEAIRHEIQRMSSFNPIQSERLVNTVERPNETKVVAQNETIAEDVPRKISNIVLPKHGSESCKIISQATAYEKLAKVSGITSGSSQADGENEQITSNLDLINVLPVSAETAGLLPPRPGNMTGSDIMLEAIVEAEVADNAKKFFADPENQIKIQ